MLVFDLDDDDVGSFQFPESWGPHDTFEIRCGANTRCWTTVAKILETDGRVTLYAEDGTELQVSLDELALSELQQERKCMDPTPPYSSSETFDPPHHGTNDKNTHEGTSESLRRGSESSNRGGMDVSKGIPFHCLKWSTRVSPVTYTSFYPLGDLAMHTATYDDHNRRVVVFGGSNGKGEESEFYEYNPELVAWRRGEVPKRPAGRHAHAATCFRGYLYIFGGIGLSIEMYENQRSCADDGRVRLGLWPPRGLCGTHLVEDLEIKGYRKSPSGASLSFYSDVWQLSRRILRSSNPPQPSFAAAKTFKWKCLSRESSTLLRARHTSTASRDGRVFLIGGISAQGGCCDYVCEAQLPIYCDATDLCGVPQLARYQRMNLPFDTREVLYLCELCRNGERFASESVYELPPERRVPQQELQWHHVPANPDRVARYGHTAVLIPEMDTILVHGGRNATGGLLGDVFTIHTETHTWRDLTALTGNSPSPRYGHAASYEQGILLVVGGQIEPSVTGNDVFALDVYQGIWYNIELMSSIPSQQPPSLSSLPPLSTHSLTRLPTYPINVDNRSQSEAVSGNTARLDSNVTTGCFIPSDVEDPKNTPFMHTHRSCALRRWLLFGGMGWRSGHQNQSVLIEAKVVPRAPQKRRVESVVGVQIPSSPCPGPEARSVSQSSKKNETSSHFARFLTRQSAWKKTRESRVDKDRARVEEMFENFRQRNQYGLHRVDDATANRLATQVRCVVLALESVVQQQQQQEVSSEGVQGVSPQPSHWVETTSVLKESVGHLQSLHRALASNDRESKFADLCQSSLSTRLQLVKQNLQTSLQKMIHLAHTTQETHSSNPSREEGEEWACVTELRGALSDFSSCRREMQSAMESMMNRSVKTFVAYVQKHEEALQRSTVKVTENYKANVWKGIFSLGYKMNSKEEKKKEADWVQTRTVRLQQSFPHVLPTDDLSALSQCATEIDALLTSNIIDSLKEEVRPGAADMVRYAQVCRSANTILASGLNREQARAMQGLTFRQAFFYANYRALEKAAGDLSTYAKDNLIGGNDAEVLKNISRLKALVVRFGKSLIGSCDAIIMAGSQGLYDRGLRSLQKRALLAEKEAAKQEAEIQTAIHQRRANRVASASRLRPIRTHRAQDVNQSEHCLSSENTTDKDKRKNHVHSIVAQRAASAAPAKTHTHGRLKEVQEGLPMSQKAMTCTPQMKTNSSSNSRNRKNRIPTALQRANSTRKEAPKDSDECGCVSVPTVDELKALLRQVQNSG